MTKVTSHILGTEEGKLDLHQDTLLTRLGVEIAERQRALEADMYEDIEILRQRKAAEMDSELVGLKLAKQQALEKELTKLKKEQQDKILAYKQLAEQEIKTKKEKALKEVSEWAERQKINIRERFELKYQERLKEFHKEYTDNIKMEFKKTREYFINLAKEKKALMEKNIEGNSLDHPPLDMADAQQ